MERVRPLKGQTRAGGRKGRVGCALATAQHPEGRPAVWPYRGIMACWSRVPDALVLVRLRLHVRKHQRRDRERERVRLRGDSPGAASEQERDGETNGPECRP